MRKISRRSFLTVSAAAAAAGVLAACGGSSSSSTAASSSAASSAASSSAADSAAAPAESYTVGICQLVQHEALDAATQGFQDALTDQLGDAVTFDLQNAQNDSPTCSTICNGFVSAGVDLIMANGTPPCRRPRPPPPTSPSWAPPSPNTAWPWVSTISAARWAATSRAPPTWPPWTSRRP